MRSTVDEHKLQFSLTKAEKDWFPITITAVTRGGSSLRCKVMIDKISGKMIFLYKFNLKTALALC